MEVVHLIHSRHTQYLMFDNNLMSSVSKEALEKFKKLNVQGRYIIVSAYQNTGKDN